MMYFIIIIRNFSVSIVKEIMEIISSSVIIILKILFLVVVGFFGILLWFFIKMGKGIEKFFLYR